MLEIRKKLSEIFSGNKTKIVSGLVILLAIVPGIWMPKLRQPPEPSVLGSFEVKLPDFSNETNTIKKNTQSMIDNFANQPLVTKPSTILANPTKIEEKPIINTKDSVISSTKLDIKPLDTIFQKSRVPVLGYMEYEDGLQKEIYSDKIEVGSNIKITFEDKSIIKTVSAGRPLKPDTQILVKKSVFEELGVDTTKYKQATIKIEKI